jgi:hypothetical protein
VIKEPTRRRSNNAIHLHPGFAEGDDTSRAIAVIGILPRLCGNPHKLTISLGGIRNKRVRREKNTVKETMA